MNSVEFCVTKSDGTMVWPDGPTPGGRLGLSRIDKLPVLRCNARTVHVFGPLGSSHGAAWSTIRQALAKALVDYYPLAGRLVTRPTDHGPVVECTGDGVWFVEASANRSLESFGYFDDVTSVPFDKLLPHGPSESEGVDPLVMMQVTEFKGDGFVMGLTFCHTICDGVGAAQFLNAVAEFARGADRLTVAPVWRRDFLPQQPTNHPSAPPPDFALLDYHLEQANIDIPLDHINQLKHTFAAAAGGGGGRCSSFEVVAAVLWRNRTRAVAVDTTVKLVFFANCRQLADPPLPSGFYGNCFFPVTITAASAAVAQAPVSDVVRLIQEAKARLPREFADWVNGGEKAEDPFASPLGYDTLFVSEWGRLGFNEVDYGEGPPRQVVPMQGSSVIPVAIVGAPPRPNRGVRLMTWCVNETHMQPFLDAMHG